MKKLLLTTLAFMAVGTVAFAQQPKKKAERKPLSTLFVTEAKKAEAKKIELQKAKIEGTATKKAAPAKQETVQSATKQD